MDTTIVMGMADPLPDRLRELRGRQGLSLKALAEKSGVSAGMLSEIERGSKNPTVRLAYQISLALGCTISELVERERDESSTRSEAIVRDAPSSVVESAGLLREGHQNPLLHGRLEVALYTLEPGATSEEMAPNLPGTIELVIVIDGSLELTLDGESRVLRKGASASHGVHATEYRNPSDTDRCRFLVLIDRFRC